MIEIIQGFKVGSTEPIDQRLIIEDTTELSDPEIMPEKYFTVSKEDGILYVYDRETNNFYKASDFIDESKIQYYNRDSEGNVVLGSLEDTVVPGTGGSFDNHKNSLLDAGDIITNSGLGIVFYNDSETYSLHAALIDKNNEAIAISNKIDLPLESAVREIKLSDDKKKLIVIEISGLEYAIDFQEVYNAYNLVNQTDLANEKARAEEAELVLTTKIGNEEIRAKSVEGNLDSLTTETHANLVAAINELESNANTEKADRIAADNVLQTNIDAEAATRIEKDSLLQTNIDNEASTRIAKDNILQNNIDAEASTRLTNDITLQNNINSEASTRLTNDNTLQANINNEATTRANSDASLSSRITSIESKMPSAASSTNKLTDKEYVDAKIEEYGAEFRGTVTSLAELKALPGNKNDYAYYKHIEGSVEVYDRYRYSSEVSPETGNWKFEVRISTSTFTEAQWNAINSGATATRLVTIETNISNEVAAREAAIAQEVTDRNAAILVETNRALGIEGGLRTDLDAEVNTNRDAAIATAVNAEKARAEGIEATKADIASLNTHTSNISNPHSVTKAQVGLDKVDNTSDADKPVSTATQSALDLKSNITYVDTELAKKQDVISDLDTIRSGAALGATAVQPATISDMASKTWVNEQGFLKEHQSLEGYAKESWVEAKGYLTEHQSLAAYRTSANQDVIDAGKEKKLTAGENIFIYDDSEGNHIIRATGSGEGSVSHIKMNGVVKDPVAGTINLGTVITEHQSLAAYRTATEQDAIHDSTKQDVLVSGTNIKTINNNSILGPGNIDIQGGGGLAGNWTTTTSNEGKTLNFIKQ